MNTYVVTLYPKGSSSRIEDSVRAGTSGEAKRIIQSRYPGASITNVEKE